MYYLVLLIIDIPVAPSRNYPVAPLASGPKTCSKSVGNAYLQFNSIKFLVVEQVREKGIIGENEVVWWEEASNRYAMRTIELLVIKNNVDYDVNLLFGE